MSTSPAMRETSLPLFDVEAGQCPPPDAVEVLVEPPPSLSLFFAECVHEFPDWVPDVRAAWAAGQAAAMRTLLNEVYVKVGDHSHELPLLGSVGLFLPGRLRISHVPHMEVAGSTARPHLHDHFYLGATALPIDSRGPGCAALPPDQARRVWPIDVYQLRYGAIPSLLASRYRYAITQTLSERVGARWLPAPRRGGSPVLVGCEQADAAFPRLICPGLARAPHDPALEFDRLLDQAYAAEPDATEERRYQIRTIEVPGALYRAEHPERVIIADILDPSDLDGR